MSEKSIIEKLGGTRSPWKFDVRPKGKYCYLSGMNGDIVIDFRRWGMQSAQPFFQRDGLIHPVETFLEPVPGEEHHKWVKQINHPDARIIEAAPEMLEALIENVLMFQDILALKVFDNISEKDIVMIDKMKSNIKTIEKACHPLKWEEIKELL